MKKIITTTAVCLLAFFANAQLFIKNETSEPVSIAVGWYSEGGSYTGYVTKGWYNIEPGETIDPGLTFTATDDYYFYYAKGWEGDTKLLVSDEAFNIKNADKQYVKDQNANYRWALFRRKDVHFEWLEKKTRTLRLTESSDNYPTSAGFTLYNKYEYTSENFSTSATLYSNGKNDYKLEYSGGTASGCTIDYNADGFYSEETKELIFTSAGCVVKFSFTPEKNLKLTSADGKDCMQYSGVGCSFYLVTYKRKPK